MHNNTQPGPGASDGKPSVVLKTAEFDHISLPVAEQKAVAWALASFIHEYQRNGFALIPVDTRIDDFYSAASRLGVELEKAQACNGVMARDIPAASPVLKVRP